MWGAGTAGGETPPRAGTKMQEALPHVPHGGDGAEPDARGDGQVLVADTVRPATPTPRSATSHPPALGLGPAGGRPTGPVCSTEDAGAAAGCHSMPPGPRQTQPPPTPHLPPPRPEGQRPGHHAPTAPARFRAALEQGRLLAPPQLTEGCVVFPPSAERPAAEDGKGLSTGAGSGLAEGHSLGRSAARHVLEPTGRLQRCAHPMLTAACSQLPGGGSNPRVHGDGGKHDGPLLRGTLLSLGWQLRHTKCGWGTVR